LVRLFVFVVFVIARTMIFVLSRLCTTIIIVIVVVVLMVIVVLLL